MNLLLDTHALIWFLNGDENQFSASVRTHIEREEKNVFVSIASLWEISIKMSIGKFFFEGGLKSFLKLIEENNFEILSISFDDLLILNNLEHVHRDPFDRILISQAISNNLLLVTKDDQINRYPVKTFW